MIGAITFFSCMMVSHLTHRRCDVFFLFANREMDLPLSKGDFVLVRQFDGDMVHGCVKEIGKDGNIMVYFGGKGVDSECEYHRSLLRLTMGHCDERKNSRCPMHPSKDFTAGLVEWEDDVC
jgi:hypothetical protein